MNIGFSVDQLEDEELRVMIQLSPFLSLLRRTKPFRMDNGDSKSNAIVKINAPFVKIVWGGAHNDMCNTTPNAQLH